MMSSYFPFIEPYDRGYLPVSSIHTLYYEQSGNPDGCPIVFLHGGPGSGVDPNHRRYFDPQFYRIILFDQRGAGQSTPHASIEENRTFDLVEDMEKLRVHLNIPKWALFGGSWGSLLALVYAVIHRKRVACMILRGLFLGLESDLNWFFRDGAPHIFPEEFENLSRFTLPGLSLIPSIYHHLVHGDPTLASSAVSAWCRYEVRALKLQFDEEFLARAQDHQKSIAIARIETHYFAHGCFLPSPDWLIQQLPSIQDLPMTLVHGRYDMVCPVANSWRLHRLLPSSRLMIAELAGHAGSEPGNLALLIDATEYYKQPSLFL